MPQKDKRIRIFAGPNGSGKSTILRKIQLSYNSGAFVNADFIEQSFKQKGVYNPESELNLIVHDENFLSFIQEKGESWNKKAIKEGTSISLYSDKGLFFTKREPNSYDAAMAADFFREELLKKGETFSYESVLSHSSKLQFLQKSQNNGFKNYLYFICTIDPTINVERVNQRQKLGGHDVPESKIIKRYYSSLEQLKEIIPLCHRAYFLIIQPIIQKKKLNPLLKLILVGI